MTGSRWDGPVVLGIETSCDETGVGIVAGGVLLADEVASSVEEQARFGGVVPEIASRAHVEALVPTVLRACRAAGISLSDVDAIAVTAGPGLAGALMVGAAGAKALGLALDRPVLGVNHLAAHVVVDELEHGPLAEGTVALLVSGGHSSLLELRADGGGFATLGATLDDAAGEAFDKVARLLGLPFPGGPSIDARARDGREDAIAFPRGLADDPAHRYDFSFSGLKTAVSRWLQQHGPITDAQVADVCASFQESVADVLSAKAVAACRDRGSDVLVLGGGVAANARLRALTSERCERAGISLRVPRPGLCTDNGAMVAALGCWLLKRGVPPSALGFSVAPVLDACELTIPA